MVGLEGRGCRLKLCLLFVSGGCWGHVWELRARCEMLSPWLKGKGKYKVATTETCRQLCGSDVVGKTCLVVRGFWWFGIFSRFDICVSTIIGWRCRWVGLVWGLLWGLWPVWGGLLSRFELTGFKGSCQKSFWGRFIYFITCWWCNLTGAVVCSTLFSCCCATPASICCCPSHALGLKTKVELFP